MTSAQSLKKKEAKKIGSGKLKRSRKQIKKLANLGDAIAISNLKLSITD